jgi:flagellum-specific peptidoglycan hydrolase FlgJ
MFCGSTARSEPRATSNEDMKEFFKIYSPYITPAATNGIFPSVKLAQAAIETNYGRSIVGNNLFGIKKAGGISPYWKGNTFKATDDLPNEDFRAYKTKTASAYDHSWFLANNPRYKAALKATTPEQQARELKAAGYATAPNYDSTIISIIDKYNLKKYDMEIKTLNYIYGTAILIIALITIYKLSKGY